MKSVSQLVKDEPFFPLALSIAYFAPINGAITTSNNTVNILFVYTHKNLNHVIHNTIYIINEPIPTPARISNALVFIVSYIEFSPYPFITFAFIDVSEISCTKSLLRVSTMYIK